MANVSIKFNGKEFLLSCEDGQEEHLEELLIQINQKFNALKNELGNLGENKLLLITAVKVMDEYYETKKKVEQKKNELKDLSNKFKEIKSLIYESFNHDDVEDELSFLKEDNKIKISILGRPNSGKSTLTNFLLKEDRQLVGEIAGLTRDTISEEFQWKKNNYIIIDTPGLRRKSKISDEVEKKSSKSSLRSVDTSDISILMIISFNFNLISLIFRRLIWIERMMTWRNILYLSFLRLVEV